MTVFAVIQASVYHIACRRARAAVAGAVAPLERLNVDVYNAMAKTIFPCVARICACFEFASAAAAGAACRLADVSVEIAFVLGGSRLNLARFVTRVIH